MREWALIVHWPIEIPNWLTDYRLVLEKIEHSLAINQYGPKKTPRIRKGQIKRKALEQVNTPNLYTTDLFVQATRSDDSYAADEMDIYRPDMDGNVLNPFYTNDSDIYAKL